MIALVKIFMVWALWGEILAGSGIGLAEDVVRVLRGNSSRFGDRFAGQCNEGV